MRRLYLPYVLFVVGLYAYATFAGTEIGAARKGVIPASVRQAPGGYRSFGFWRGGK
ncbi:MAG: hypothetical protein U0166_05610 [Acidobacteriota bacterium]